MTGCTAASDNTLMAVTGWLPDGGCMAGIAGLRRWDVGSRLGLGIECRVGPGMTTCTLSRRSGVIHYRRCECRVIGMASVALGCCRNVVGRLTQSIRPVMAG